MPSGYTARLRLEKQFTGENINLWGDKLNATLDRVDDFAGGYLAVAITGNTAITSANDNTAADQARMASLKFTGALSSTATITIPSVGKLYWVWNGCTGGSITITTGSGNTVTVPAGDIAPVFCDGTNVKTLTISTYDIKGYVDQVAWTYNAGNLPAQVGNAGKFVTTDGTNASWSSIASTDLSDYSTAILGVQVALAVAL